MLEGFTGDDRRGEAVHIFERTLGDWEESHKQMREDNDFRDGKQWSDDDKAALKEQQRPVLSFNMTKFVVDHLVGTYEDNRMKAKSVPVGMEDVIVTQLINRIADRAEHEARSSDRLVEAFERAAITGLGFIHIDVEPARGSADELKVTLASLGPFDVKIDPRSVEPDMSDARFIFMDKWLSKGEFRAEYPDHASKAAIARIFTDADDNDITRGSAPVSNLNDVDGPHDRTLGSSTLWFDSNTQQVRVVHMEYWQSVRMVRVVNPLTGEVETFTERDYRRIQQRFEGVNLELEVVDRFWDQEMRWFDFVKDETLFDDLSPLPIDGFSVIAVVANREGNTGMPYGVVRNLKDSQREMNKRWSQMLHLLVQQGQPGMYAEEDALVNINDARIAQKEPGGIVMLKSGALAGGKVQERGIPQFPDAPAKIHEMAFQMLSRIGGVNADSLLGPRGVPPAAATAELEHRKSLMTVRRLLMNAQSAQKQLRKALTQIVVNTFSDQQLTMMLGEPQRLIVQRGIILDQQSGEQIAINDLRALRYDVEMDVFAEHSSQRLLELQTLLMLAQTGVPVDPTVLIEDAVTSREKRFRLAKFASDAQQSASQSQEQQLKAQLAIEQGKQQLQAGEMQRKAKHDAVLEQQAAVDSERQHERELYDTIVDAIVKLEQADQQALLGLLQTITAAVPREPASASA